MGDPTGASGIGGGVTVRGLKMCCERNVSRKEVDAIARKHVCGGFSRASPPFTIHLLFVLRLCPCVATVTQEAECSVTLQKVCVEPDKKVPPKTERQRRLLCGVQCHSERGHKGVA